VEHTAVASCDLSSHEATSPFSAQLPVQQSVSFTQTLPFDLQLPALAPPELDEHAASETTPIEKTRENKSAARMREACAQKSALAI
jgi:hypothetical protein